MPSFDLPALYSSSDQASNRMQRSYLRLVRGEYALLIAAACMSLIESTDPIFLGAYALTFIGSLGALAWRAHTKPEQGWYKSRALAESIKTLTWRYAMRSEPFDDTRQADAKKDFRDTLAALLRSNRHIGELLAGLETGSQITDRMSAMRGSALRDRKAHYLNNRVSDQQAWYTKKAKYNKDAATRWQWIGAGSYVAAIMMVLAHVRFVDVTFPVEPVIVVASAILGWMQIKKFNELASAYALTAHEISLAKTLIDDAKTEQDFSKAVNEVELVFSREHTQWIARQTAGE